MQEFEAIRRFFAERARSRPDVILGSGDDCALLRPPADQLLATSIDALVEGVHFFPGTDPQALGHKAMAVSLSDLAAMGAEPAWAIATLSMPSMDESWCSAFADGIFSLLDAYNVALVGGDLVRGPLVISSQLTGFVPESLALRRTGAQVGDLIVVTGTLGDAAMAVHQLSNNQSPAPEFLERLQRPTPRVATGMALRNLASSAIDISDGLLADLAHLLEQPSAQADNQPLGAELDIDLLPLSSALATQLSIDRVQVMRCALSGGDDYELCFTIPEQNFATAQSLCPDPLTQIGVITAESGVRVLEQGKVVQPPANGYQHF